MSPDERNDGPGTSHEAETLPPPVAGASREAPHSSQGATVGEPLATHWPDSEVFHFLAPARRPDELGRLGPYRVLQPLGKGGMGLVFRAEDPELGRHVALKTMRPELAVEPSARARFLREARSAAALEHDNVVAIFQVGEDRGVPYIAMPLLRGETLEDRLHRVPYMPLAEALRIARETAEGLAAAHAAGLIHRDIKPLNLWLELPPRCRVKILDFGLAGTCQDVGGQTERGAIMGSIGYLAPEQAEGQPVDVRADLFSLGVVLYRMLTRKMPYPGKSMIQYLGSLATLTPRPPQLLNPDVPELLSALAMSLLATSPDDRPDSAQVVCDALRRIEDRCEPHSRKEVAGVQRAAALAAPQRLRPESLRFAFVGYGEQAPPVLRDRLFLDVGNDLRPGVIDHHQADTTAISTASLVLRRPDLVLAALSPGCGPADPFTIVLHEHPDLDAVAASWLATSLLTSGALPAGAEVLARYVDKVDQGSLGMSLANPFALYAAYQRLAGRLLLRPNVNRHESWQEAVRRGIELISFAVIEMASEQRPLTAVDAFACPGLFTAEDRAAVLADADIYQRKLREPRCRARRTLLKLPGQFGGLVEAWSLRVRDVQNSHDPERCQFFKDWARTDAKHSPDGKGFAALSVFHSEGPGQVRRCILSVAPDSGATLRGLGMWLDGAEAEVRRQMFGVDDRVADPATGRRKEPRPGYDNADPWYDGRGHGYTIVDSPRDGTLLTAERIEALFLAFGS